MDALKSYFITSFDESSFLGQSGGYPKRMANITFLSTCSKQNTRENILKTASLS